MKALTSPAYARLKNVPKVTNEEEATQLLLTVIPFAFFLRVERGMPTGTSTNSPKGLQITQMQTFVASDYYAWFYEGSQWTTYLGGVAMVAVMLAGVMFPLWPSIMRLGVWYLSIAVLGLIGLFFALAIVRLIFYIITVIVASPGIWIFPKLFADVGFVGAFFPSFTPPKLRPLSAAPTLQIIQTQLGLYHVLTRSSPSSRSGNGTSPKRRPRRSGPRRKSPPRANPLLFPKVRPRQPSPPRASKRFPTRRTPVQQADKPA